MIRQDTATGPVDVDLATAPDDTVVAWALLGNTDAALELLRRQRPEDSGAGTLPPKRAHVRAEYRELPLSTVEREIVKVGDNCEACRTNTDPRKVPVHPNCNCEVITQNVQTGVEAEAWAPVETWIRENGKLRFVQGNVGRPAAATEAGEAIAPMADTGDDLVDLTIEALSFEPSSAMILEIEDSRWSDVERWMSKVDPLLQTGDYVVTIIETVEDAQEDVQDIMDTVQTVTATKEVAEELKSRRFMVALAKLVTGA